jgi:hypothetical protein
MLTPKFFEAMNGTLFVLLLFAVVMFGVYSVREMIINGFSRTRLQASIACGVTFLGDAVIRGWVWYWRHLENAGVSNDWMEHHPTLVVGLVFEILGIICVIRVFAPDRWGRNMWVISTLVSIGVTTFFMSI